MPFPGRRDDRIDVGEPDFPAELALRFCRVGEECGWISGTARTLDHLHRLADHLLHGANHGAIAYGHIGADLIALAAILRVPVDMHNVPSDRVFRPSVWNRFGAMEAQAADYRACAAYGPLYR